MLRSLTSIIKLTTRRCCVVFSTILSLPVVVGVPTPAPGYPKLDSTTPNYYGFTLNSTSIETVLADSKYFRTGSMQYQAWTGRAHKIRAAGNDMYCLGICLWHWAMLGQHIRPAHVILRPFSHFYSQRMRSSVPRQRNCGSCISLYHYLVSVQCAIPWR
jgi:hypothetical protein